MSPHETSNLGLTRSETQQTSSTNSTASGLPGPGRTVDVFLSAAGRRLEQILSAAAERMGGPEALVADMLTGELPSLLTEISDYLQDYRGKHRRCHADSPK